VSGDSTKLTCELRIAGTFAAAVTWNRDGAVVPTEDGSGIGNALLSVDLSSVGSDDDKATYQCVMRVAEAEEHLCSVTLDVECKYHR